MAIKESKKTREFIYRLCNGLRRQKDICEYLMRHHVEFTNKSMTEKTVEHHLLKLKEEGLIHFKYDGRIIDLQR